MPQSKEMYQSGKGHKAISKALGLQRTTVRAIIQVKLVTVVNLPRSGWPTKITPRAQRQLIQEVIKEPRTTSKELQASLASIKVSVHDSTIRKRLGKNGIHGRVPRQKPLLTKKNTKAHLTVAKKYLDYPQDFWANILWTVHFKAKVTLILCVFSGSDDGSKWWLLYSLLHPTTKHFNRLIWDILSSPAPESTQWWLDCLQLTQLTQGGSKVRRTCQSTIVGGACTELLILTGISEQPDLRKGILK